MTDVGEYAKKQSWSYLGYNSSILLAERRKTMKIFNQESVQADSNPETPEYKS